LQVFRVEFGEHLFGRNPVTDIDRALDDLATDAERKLGLHPRMNIAGQGDRGAEIGRFDLLHENPWKVLLDLCFFTTSGQQHQDAQGNCYFQSRTNHADSFALYGRASDDTTVRVEQGSKGASGPLK